MLYGARTSLVIAFFATGLALMIGVTLGMIAGFYRGKVDTLISRTTDVVLSLPILLLALGLASACGASAEGCLGGLIKPGLMLVSLIIGLFSWPYIARIVRGQVLSLREKEFIEASRSLGSSQLPHHAARDPAERGRADHRVHHPDHPQQHPVRGGSVVPRCGRSGLDAVLGRHARVRR